MCNINNLLKEYLMIRLIRIIILFKVINLKKKLEWQNRINPKPYFSIEIGAYLIWVYQCFGWHNQNWVKRADMICMNQNFNCCEEKKKLFMSIYYWNDAHRLKSMQNQSVNSEYIFLKTTNENESRRRVKFTSYSIIISRLP